MRLMLLGLKFEERMWFPVSIRTRVLQEKSGDKTLRYKLKHVSQKKKYANFTVVVWLWVSFRLNI